RLYRKTGDYSKAESFDARALTILETALGPDDPNLADALSDRSLLYRAKGDVAMAVSYQSRANNISARNVAMNVAGGSEREKVVYLNTFTDRTNQTVSLHVL